MAKSVVICMLMQRINFCRDRMALRILRLRYRIVSFRSNSFRTHLVRYFAAPFCSFRNSVFKIFP